MIRQILRVGLGTVFFSVFLSFLFVGALKFRVLSSQFWKNSLAGDSLYQMTGDLKKVLTAQRFAKIVETNIDRLFEYIDGKSEEIVLYLPVRELNLPAAALKQPMISKMTERTKLTDVLVLFGMKGEQTKTMVDGLNQMRTYLGYLVFVLAGLFLLVVGVLAGHYFLGVGLADRVGGTSWLLVTSGFMAKLIGDGAGRLFELFATGSKPPMPAWGVELGRSLVGQFFDLGATIGLVVGVVGLVGVGLGFFLGKREKTNKNENKPGLIKKLIIQGLGTMLGLAILGGSLVGVVLGLGGKVDFNVSSGGENKEENLKLAEEYYKSDGGWQIKFPVGWGVVKDEKWEGVVKKPKKIAADWAMIKIGPITRLKEVDGGGYLEALKQGFNSGKSFKNAVLFEEPYEERREGNDWKRFVFTVDYDDLVAGKTVRVRLLMWQHFPTKGGTGIVIMATTPVESWAKYEKILKESVGTFKVDGL